MEIWKDVVGYEGVYQVSNLSRVRRTKSGRVLSPFMAKGYLLVVLWSGNKEHGFAIHRLAAIAFIPNPNNYPCINHKDEDKLNNKIENLEWCTHKYNSNYGACRQKIGDANGKPVIQKTKNGEIVMEYKSGRQAERETGISSTHISSCVNGNRRTTGGFIWEKVGG